MAVLDRCASRLPELIHPMTIDKSFEINRLLFGLEIETSRNVSRRDTDGI
jgi:hypothetical protein